jgi:hypothetical protein
MSFTFDAIPEDDEVQDELNRLLRKPGDPPYDPTAKWLDPPKSSTVKTDGAAAAKPAKE